MPFAYLIRLPNDQAHERAIMAWLEVREPRQVFTDRRMLVTNEHVGVLKKRRIPFECLSEPPDGKKKVRRRKGSTPLSS